MNEIRLYVTMHCLGHMSTRSVIAFLLIDVSFIRHRYRRLSIIRRRHNGEMPDLMPKNSFYIPARQQLSDIQYSVTGHY